MSDAAERVEALLREHKERTAIHDVIEVAANGKTLTLPTGDLSILVECAQWLLMASNAELTREYATTSESQGLEGPHLRPTELDIAERDIEHWNRLSRRKDEGFVATRLVSPWERRA